MPAISGLVISGLGAVASWVGLRKKNGAGQSQSAKTGGGSNVSQTQVAGSGSTFHGPVTIQQGDPALTEDVAVLKQQVTELKERMDQLASYTGGIPDLEPDDPIRQCVEAAGRLMDEFRWDDAVTELQAALELPTTPRQRASIHNRIGLVRYGPSDLDRALEAWSDSLREAERIEDEGERNKATALALCNIGLALQGKGDSDGALDRFRRSEEMFEQMGQLQNQADALGNIGVVLFTKGDLDGALEKYRDADRIDRATLGDEHPNVASRVNNIGSVLLAHGDHKGAAACATMSFRILLRAHGPRGQNTVSAAQNLLTLDIDPIPIARELAGDEAATELAVALAHE